MTQLTASLRASLEGSFPSVWVEGEISNLRRPVSGHLYFSLKDEESRIRAVAFRRLAASLPFQPEDGLLVLAKGRVSLYEPRGDCQLLLEALEPKGPGALQVAFEQLKKRLDLEGLFDPARKRPLPFFPRRVGVVTSVTGAAVHDIVTVIRRRCSLVGLRLFPVAVQGADAARQIAEAVGLAGRQHDLDVLIVGRGGGSWEDLWSFNDEAVVRAIAGSRLPVVSAVGHATDVTLSDFAADYRAPTPSAAAEAVSPVLADMQAGIRDTRARLLHALRNALASRRARAAAVCRALPHPVQLMQRRMQRVDELAGRLVQSMRAACAVARPKLAALSGSLARIGTGQSWRRAGMLVPQLLKRIRRAGPWVVAHNRHRVRTAAGALQALSPLSILSRGYSILETCPGGTVVKDARTVAVGDRLRARLAEGRLSCRVEDAGRQS